MTAIKWICVIAALIAVAVLMALEASREGIEDRIDVQRAARVWLYVVTLLAAALLVVNL